VAIVGALTRGFAKSQRKVAAVQGAITGTGNLTSGLSVIDTGSAQVTSQNSATTIPSNFATVTSITNGTVAVMVNAAAAAANAVSGVAGNIGLLCTGY
jgi:hypothetical protein